MAYTGRRKELPSGRVAITVVALARCGGGDVLRYADGGGRLTAIKQSSNQASFFLTEEQGRTIEHTESKDFGASRKNFVKHRAKRNHLPTLWT
jgi:hypothetical protein